jgi:GntR family transcriptional regulator/MocR family aminotransferase
LHILAKLADHEDDVALGALARAAGLAVHSLSPWYINAKPRQGLLMGFANVIDEKDAMQLALKLKQALI